MPSHEQASLYLAIHGRFSHGFHERIGAARAGDILQVGLRSLELES